MDLQQNDEILRQDPVFINPLYTVEQDFQTLDETSTRTTPFSTFLIRITVRRPGILLVDERPALDPYRYSTAGTCRLTCPSPDTYTALDLNPSLISTRYLRVMRKGC